MTLNEHIAKINATVADQSDTSESAKQARNSAFWDAATDAFNDLCAGDVKLADGRTATIPSIQL